jgi:hypothetical protein
VEDGLRRAPDRDGNGIFETGREGLDMELRPPARDLMLERRVPVVQMGEDDDGSLLKDTSLAWA